MYCEVTFTVFPDADCDPAAVRAACRAPGARVLAHASRRPWLVGRWPVGAVRWAAAGTARVAVVGPCAVPAGALVRAASRLRDLSDLDAVAREVHGSGYLAASVGGRVRVQGTVSGARSLFYARLGGVTVAADRPGALAELTGAGVDEDEVALRLLAPAVPYPLRERPVWRGVRQVQPDALLVLEADGTARTLRRWVPPAPVLSRDEGAAAVGVALASAVRARVEAHRAAVGSDLSEASGGADALARLTVVAGGRLVTVPTSADLPPSEDALGRDALGRDDLSWADRIVRPVPPARLPADRTARADTTAGRVPGAAHRPTDRAPAPGEPGLDGSGPGDPGADAPDAARPGAGRTGPAGAGLAGAGQGAVAGAYPDDVCWVVRDEPPTAVRSVVRYAAIGRQLAELGLPLHLAADGAGQLFTGPDAYLHTLARTRPGAAVRHVHARRTAGRWPLAATWRALADPRPLPAWLAGCAARLDAVPQAPRRPELGWTPDLRMPPWATGEALSVARRRLLAAAEERPEPLAAGRGDHRTLEALRQAGAAVRYAEWLTTASYGVRIGAPYLDDAVIDAVLAVRPDQRRAADGADSLLDQAVRAFCGRLAHGDLAPRVGRAEGPDPGGDAARAVAAYGRGGGAPGDVPGAGAGGGDGPSRRRGLAELFDGSCLGRRGLVDDAEVRAVLGATHAPAPSLAALGPTVACELWLRALSDDGPPTALAAALVDGRP